MMSDKLWCCTVYKRNTNYKLSLKRICKHTNKKIEAMKKRKQSEVEKTTMKLILIKTEEFTRKAVQFKS